jgi:thiol-disulfide isomerase/thioredoxin
MKIVQSFFVFVFTLFLFAACNNKEKIDTGGFTIQGKISNGGVIKQVSVQELTASGLIMVDTAVLDADGQFTLKGKLPEKTFCLIRFEKGDVVLLVDTNAKLTLSIDANDIKNYKVQGSKENDELKELYLLNDSFMRMSSQINERFASYNENTLTPKVQEEIKNAFDSLQKSHKTAIKANVGSLTNSLVPYFATTFLLPEPDEAFLEAIDNTLFNKFQNSKYAIFLHQRLEGLKKTAIGALAPDIVLNDPFGKKVSLSGLSGKIVLVDFWASWCGPCREENPRNVALYNKYKSKGFEIFGVSLDENRDAWINAINKDHLLWQHGSDLQKWNSPIVNQFSIEAIPYTILVDKEGKIMAKKLRGKELEAKLFEIFGF